MERTVEFLKQKLVERVFCFIEREERKKGPVDTAMLRDTKTNTPIEYRIVEEICQLEADLPPLLVLEYQH